jgi:hypothetical protein
MGGSANMPQGNQMGNSFGQGMPTNAQGNPPWMMGQGAYMPRGLQGNVNLPQQNPFVSGMQPSQMSPENSQMAPTQSAFDAMNAGMGNQGQGPVNFSLPQAAMNSPAGQRLASMHPMLQGATSPESMDIKARYQNYLANGGYNGGFTPGNPFQR